MVGRADKNYFGVRVLWRLSIHQIPAEHSCNPLRKFQWSQSMHELVLQVMSSNQKIERCVISSCCTSEIFTCGTFSNSATLTMKSTAALKTVVFERTGTILKAVCATQHAGCTLSQKAHVMTKAVLVRGKSYLRLTRCSCLPKHH